VALKLRWGATKVEDALFDLARVVSLIFDLSLAIEKAIFRLHRTSGRGQG